jgi:hypothetical protein
MGEGNGAEVEAGGEGDAWRLMHTGPPWSRGNLVPWARIPTGLKILWEGGGLDIARLPTEASAEFIERAVKAHEALVRATKVFDQYLCGILANDEASDGEHDEAMHFRVHIDTALGLAQAPEGETPRPEPLE